jgi:AcrR family transcriptional regulator
MPRPKQRTPELRDRVLSVAVPLLAREGAAGFTARSVARAADTSPPAIYELFGDKGGLLREIFFEGFRILGEQMDAVARSEDPRADLTALLTAYRSFMRENPILSEVMFSRPFADFSPGPSELKAGNAVRAGIVAGVARCVEADVLRGDATDIAHVLVSLIQGLAAAENARRLGRSPTSIERRWTLAVEGVLVGLGRDSGESHRRA